MNEVAEILAQPETAKGAERLKQIYHEITGIKLQTGCFCKSYNITKTYMAVREWASNQTNQ